MLGNLLRQLTSRSEPAAAQVPAGRAQQVLESLRPGLHALLRQGDVAGALQAVAPVLAAEAGTLAQRNLIEFSISGIAGFARSEQWRDDLAYRLGATLLALEDEAGATLCAAIIWGQEEAARGYRKFMQGPSLPAYCASAGLPCKLDESIEVQPMSPVYAGAFEPYPASLCLLREGLVLGHSFLPATREGVVFVERCIDTPRKLYRHDGLEWLDVVRMASETSVWTTGSEPVRHAGRHVLLGNHDNIGHWLLYYFSRLRVLDTAGELRDAKVIVGDNVRALHLDCLARAGIGEERIVRVPKGGLAQFEELWVPSLVCGVSPGEVVYCAPGTLQDVRRRLGVAPPAGGGQRRLFLSRRGARWRRLLNEDAVAAALAKLGFEEVDAGALSLAQQIGLAGEAQAIVGVFGAAMNFHLFAGEGVPVVQLQFDENPRMNIHPLLASMLRQPFHAVVGEVPKRNADPLKSDFTVPVDAMLAVVSGALER